jgi:hypothetical protein
VGRYCVVVVSQLTLGVSSGHGPGGTAADSRLADTSAADSSSCRVSQ